MRKSKQQLLDSLAPVGLRNLVSFSLLELRRLNFLFCSMCRGVLLSCVCLCIDGVPGAIGEQKRALDPLVLKLQTVVGAEN